mmetsp:Transcript_56514/g.64537  ORF Transcript_56514/g.64537 Transcript_56514/m.64537 type:complete len:239 (+) Transcript_56514:59-775(+)
MHVHFIRHSESTNNVIDKSDMELYRKRREADPGITPKGSAQCEKVGESLNKLDKPCEILFSSPMKRALLSSKSIAKSSGLKTKLWCKLYEDQGCHQQGKPFGGLTAPQVKELFPDIELDDIIDEEGWYKANSEEDPETAYSRAVEVVNALSEFAQEKRYSAVAILSHGNFLDLVFKVIFGVPQDSKLKYLHENCGISTVVFMEDYKKVVYRFNSISHIESSPATSTNFEDLDEKYVQG